MMYANAIDSDKLRKAVLAMVLSHVAEEEDDGAPAVKQLYVNHRDFYRSCRLSQLRRDRFAEEVNDVLSATEVSRKIGNWVYTEVGDNYYAFLYLGGFQKGNVGVRGLINHLVERHEALLVSFTEDGRALISAEAEALAYPDDDEGLDEDDSDEEEPAVVLSEHARPVRTVQNPKPKNDF